uniref:Uncharacterized protein n=1 Tax=viral metagenome TaxID=1070528 RepID=A0A6M3LK55_9ZZZZ
MLLALVGCTQTELAHRQGLIDEAYMSIRRNAQVIDTQIRPREDYYEETWLDKFNLRVIAGDPNKAIDKINERYGVGIEKLHNSLVYPKPSLVWWGRYKNRPICVRVLWGDDKVVSMGAIIKDNSLGDLGPRALGFTRIER